MEAEANRRALRERAYAMKKHHATRLHYDLRLEWNGVLLSWALPDGPSCCGGAIRQAIEMEDHNRANLLFEGVHETGPIMLWDRGTVGATYGIRRYPERSAQGHSTIYVTRRKAERWLDALQDQ
jgi:DNA ligase D-like protein (predicted 3'-phosphoesterase)